ncbi:type I-E CRISPR-associated protein Cas6/Cse3/CasE [Streptomyces sp. NPDC052396]|uniref:type I-E CRISPR-associated protein Cas6/Cse3/CasE n=1 Tax=Streptomyces sp. NPDC052396 TaxID=3365689 RepID=UPI0037D287DD
MSPTATLARIRLNLQSRAVQRDLRDPTQMHRTLMRLVPDHLGNTPRQNTGLLYRLDEAEHSSTLLVQAAVPLDATQLPRDYGRTHVKSLAPMFSALRKGLPVRYRITVSPTKSERRPGPDKRRGKITPLSGPAADEWWNRRATSAGLQLHTLLPVPQRPISAHGKDPAATVQHCLMRYDGMATISDPTALTNALLTGIGRGKPYGAGLLSLAPACTP